MKRTSEHVEQWRKDLPRVQALTPYGRARASLRFKLVPSNPDGDRLGADLYEWALRTGLFAPEQKDDLQKTRIGHLMYWISPLASVDVLWVLGTANLWVIAVDDAVVETGAPLDELQRACDEAIRTGKTTGELTPYSRYFIELRDKLLGYKCDGLLPQIAEEVASIFDAWKQQQRYVADDTLPSLSDYIKLRVGITAMCMLAHVQRCQPGLLPHEKRFSERLDKLAQLMSVLVGLNGDIVGIQKDIEDGFFINVIPVIALDFGVDLVTAYFMAVEVLDIYKQMFDALVVDVCMRPGDEPHAPVQALAIAQWLDALHTWHMTGPRHGAGQVPDELRAAMEALGKAQEGALSREVMNRLGKPSGAAATESTSIGKEGLGTSALRFSDSLRGAEMLKHWAQELLGWSTPEASAPPEALSAVPFTEIKPTGLGAAASLLREIAAAPAPSAHIVEFKPTGLGNAAATIAAMTTTQSQTKSPGPSNDAPGASPPIPGLTGLGTSAASLSALAPKAPAADVPPTH